MSDLWGMHWRIPGQLDRGDMEFFATTCTGYCGSRSNIERFRSSRSSGSILFAHSCHFGWNLSKIGLTGLQAQYHFHDTKWRVHVHWSGSTQTTGSHWTTCSSQWVLLFGIHCYLRCLQCLDRTFMKMHPRFDMQGCRLVQLQLWLCVHLLHNLCLDSTVHSTSTPPLRYSCR